MLFLFGLQFCFNRYDKSKKYRYIVLSGVFMIIYMLSVFFNSRWNILLPAIIYMYLASIHFKKRFKILAICVGIVFVVGFISITLYKFAWIFQRQGSSFGTIFTVLTQQSQEYFSGPRPLAQGFEAIDKYRDNIDEITLVNDYAGTIPFLSHYINQNDRINIYYNWYIKGEGVKATQIMPIMSIGYAYFGEFGAGILLIIYLAISMRLGHKEEKTTNVFYKYIDCYSIIALNMSIYFNTQIVLGFLTNLSIPVFIALFLNNHINWNNKIFDKNMEK